MNTTLAALLEFRVELAPQFGIEWRRLRRSSFGGRRRRFGRHRADRQHDQAAAERSATNGIIQASRLKPSVVGAERIFSPYLRAKEGDNLRAGHPAGRSCGRSRSRSGTEKPQSDDCSWPPSGRIRIGRSDLRATSCDGGLSANVTRARSAAQSAQAHADDHRARCACGVWRASASVTSGHGLAREFALRAARARARGDRGALAHVRPHHDHGAEHHHRPPAQSQNTSGVRKTWKVASGR